MLAVALGVWLAPLVLAADEKAEQETKIKIPDTAAAILQEVKKQETDLGSTIAAKKLDIVHQMAFAIRDLVNALPDKSTELAADKLNKVKANSKFVASLASRLDQSGDAKNQAATETNFKKLQSLLKEIEAQYP